MNKEQAVIKKYENRRMYDTKHSRYVNLDEIAEMIRKGTDVKIVDARTGEDLTRITLTQIIVEDAKQGPAGLPLELLKQLIVASDHVGKEFIMWYLKSAFDAYQKLQNTISGGFSEVQTAAMSPVEALKNFLRGPEERKPENTEIEELRRRLSELETRTGDGRSKRNRGNGRRATAKRAKTKS